MCSTAASIDIRNYHELDQQLRAIPGWQGEYYQMSPGSFAGRTVHVALEGVEIFEEQMNLRVEQTFRTPVDALVFSFDMKDSTLHILTDQASNTWVTPADYCELAVVFKRSASMLDGLAADLGDLILTPLQSKYCRLFSHWLSTTLHSAARNPAAGLPLGIKEQLLEDCFFILEQEMDGVSSEVVRSEQSRKAIRRVIELVEDSPCESFSAPELASAAGVSLRRLQQLFRAYAGMSPTQWLRLRRLNAVRRDLMRSTAAETTVAEVAMRWSFWHLGRFAQSYYSLFGEHPSTTLLHSASASEAPQRA